MVGFSKEAINTSTSWFNWICIHSFCLLPPVVIREQIFEFCYFVFSLPSICTLIIPCLSPLHIYPVYFSSGRGSNGSGVSGLVNIMVVLNFVRAISCLTAHASRLPEKMTFLSFKHSLSRAGLNTSIFFTSTTSSRRSGGVWKIGRAHV